MHAYNKSFWCLYVVCTHSSIFVVPSQISGAGDVAGEKKMTNCVCCVMYHSVTRQPVGCAHISDLAETIYYLGISIAQRRKFVTFPPGRLYVEFVTFPPDKGVLLIVPHFPKLARYSRSYSPSTDYLLEGKRLVFIHVLLLRHEPPTPRQ